MPERMLSRFCAVVTISVLVVCLGCATEPSGPPPTLSCPDADPGCIARQQPGPRHISGAGGVGFPTRYGDLCTSQRIALRSRHNCGRLFSNRFREPRVVQLQRDGRAPAAPRESQDARVRRQHHLWLQFDLSWRQFVCRVDAGRAVDAVGGRSRSAGHVVPERASSQPPGTLHRAVAGRRQRRTSRGVGERLRHAPPVYAGPDGTRPRDSAPAGRH